MKGKLEGNSRTAFILFTYVPCMLRTEGTDTAAKQALLYTILIHACHECEQRKDHVAVMKDCAYR